MNKVQFEAFVIPFYRKFMGFWVLILIFGGVFMELKQHILLGRFAFSYPSAFSVVPVSFGIYSFLQLRFQLEQLKHPKYFVFHQLGLWPKVVLAKFWIGIWLANHLIFLIYLIFLSYFGVEKHAWGLLFILWTTVFLTLIINWMKVDKSLESTISERKLYKPFRHIRLPRFTWLILHLRQERPLLALGTKILSIILLSGFFNSYSSGTYDIRWLQFGTLVVAFLHFPILLEKVDFENEKLVSFRNLPLRISQKTANHFWSLTLVLIPELLFFLWKGPKILGTMEVAELVFLLLSLTVGLLSQISISKIKAFPLQYLSGSFFLFFLFILFGISGWGIGILSMAIFYICIRDPFEL